jgi:4a-hydroxytetrahydrobiopterin dehydratase
MTGLTAKTCTACQGGIPAMSETEARARMDEIPGWQLKDIGARLERSWTTRDYAEAYRIVVAASELAEAEGHHPDIRFGWGYCTISVYTHKIGGLHENDFILAAKINAAVG